jgi:ubiquinone/menaquinone biosynthesis C-methylase UbiE
MTESSNWSASFARTNLDVMRMYDEILVPRLFTSWARKLLDAVDVAPGEAVADVACGPGSVARLAAERVGAEGRVTACDLNPSMLEIARAKPATAHAAAVEYVECPADALTVASGTYDVVTCQQGLQFFPDHEGALAEMHRVLRPGGRIGIAVWCPIEECPPFAMLASAVSTAFGQATAAEYRSGPWGLTDSKQLTSLLDRAGFTDVDVQTHRLPVVFEGGTDQLLATLAAASVADKIRAADDATRNELARSAAQAAAPFMVNGAIEAYTTSHIATATA